MGAVRPLRPTTPAAGRPDRLVLGPVNATRISIDGGHFLSGQGALSAMYLGYISERATPSWEKWPRPIGLALQRDHSALRITYLEPPNRALRALPGLFGGPTLGIRIVLTGPKRLAAPRPRPALLPGRRVSTDAGYRQIGGVRMTGRAG